MPQRGLQRAPYLDAMAKAGALRAFNGPASLPGHPSPGVRFALPPEARQAAPVGLEVLVEHLRQAIELRHAGIQEQGLEGRGAAAFQRGLDDEVVDGVEALRDGAHHDGEFSERHAKLADGLRNEPPRH